MTRKISTVKASVVVIPAKMASGTVNKKRKGTIMAYMGLMRAMIAVVERTGGEARVR